MSLCAGDHEQLLNRLNRIEGQVRGLRRMVEEDRNCFEVLKQVAAVDGAMKSLGRVILDSHLRGCVSEAMRSDRRNDRLIDEVMEVFDKFSS
jgi:DNA-binding FrmR family transcriptional regulator